MNDGHSDAASTEPCLSMVEHNLCHAIQHAPPAGTSMRRGGHEHAPRWARACAAVGTSRGGDEHVAPARRIK